MKVDLHILNPYRMKNISETGTPVATWYMRTKSYETDFYGFDEDVINSPIGHELDRIVLNDIQLTSVPQIEELEKFLKNAKESFKF